MLICNGFIIINFKRIDKSEKPPSVSTCNMITLVVLIGKNSLRSSIIFRSIKGFQDQKVWESVVYRHEDDSYLVIFQLFERRRWVLASQFDTSISYHHRTHLSVLVFSQSNVFTKCLQSGEPKLPGLVNPAQEQYFCSFPSAAWIRRALCPLCVRELVWGPWAQHKNETLTNQQRSSLYWKLNILIKNIHHRVALLIFISQVWRMLMSSGCAWCRGKLPVAEWDFFPWSAYR